MHLKQAECSIGKYCPFQKENWTSTPILSIVQEIDDLEKCIVVSLQIVLNKKNDPELFEELIIFIDSTLLVIRSFLENGLQKTVKTYI